jgi:glycosyltransferase involved in cell wall biosynthesis
VAIVAEAFLPKVDGVSKTAYLTLQYLQQTGREVLVFAPDTAPHEVSGSRVIPLPSLGMPLAPETRVALPSRALGRYLDEFRPDIIHLFSPALLSASGMAAGRRRGIPVIANYQTDLPAYATQYGYGLLSRPIRAWLRYIHNGCHLTLVPSSFTLRQIQGWGYRRLRRWGRGVDSQRFSPERRSADWRARLLHGRDPASLLCVYVGRLAAEKRLDLLIDVARTPGVALTIIGDGALRDDLERQFAGTGTHFMGYLYGDDLANAYASADAFVFTGAYETFGQVVQEALASGLPAVVINQGGVCDLVQEGKTGYSCPADAAAFAQAVRRLRDHPELRARLGQNARRFAERRPWSAIMAQLEGYYREAVHMNTRLKRFTHHNMNRLSISLPPLLGE